jgi:hypothetical protein
MERKVPMGIYQTVTAAQKTSAEAILALVLARNCLAGDTKFVIEGVAKSVVPQQLIQRALSNFKLFTKSCLCFISNDSNEQEER